MNPYISVVIPNYNYEAYLKKCIDSVLTQNYNYFEVIIVDDCSTDNSRELILSYGDRVKPIFPEENGGHGQAFNLGFSHSKGDIVAFLDADDFANEGWLSSLAASYESDSMMYHHYANLVDESNNIIGIFPSLSTGLDTGNLSEKLRTIGRIKTTVTSALAFSRKALLQVMPMDKIRYSQGADGYLASTVPLYGKVKKLDGNLTSYRQHSRGHSKFDNTLLKRAEWSYHHNTERYYDIKKLSNKLGKPCKKILGTNDILFLEQLLVLNVYPNAINLNEDHLFKRYQIYKLAISASNNHYVNQPKWLRLWWFACTYSPKTLARVLLKWKLQASSRPRWLINLQLYIQGR